MVALTSGYEMDSSTSFNWPAANTSIWLSSAAYCARETYLKRSYKGASAGFVPTFVIYDSTYDTNGYIGYRTEDETIYVVYRGSSSIRDWLDDLDAILTTYPYCKDCQVHKGFYKAELNVIAMVQTEVARLRLIYPSYKIIITGHSLGAALAALTVVDLSMLHSNLELFNYGCPRVGNQAFASFFSNNIIQRNRVTHHKDTVPHCPMHERFTHFSGEFYHEDKTGGDLVMCTGYEDPKCSYQWTITSIEDHMLYLGLSIGCESV